jgi:hypothetical protein
MAALPRQCERDFTSVCMNIKVFIRPPINAHPPQADCALSIGLRLDAYINLLRLDM